jgi:hypothetical protein
LYLSSKTFKGEIKMAGKATSVYVTVEDRENKCKAVEHKKFFRTEDANIWIKANEEKYPKPKYNFVKETY